MLRTFILSGLNKIRSEIVTSGVEKRRCIWNKPNFMKVSHLLVFTLYALTNQYLIRIFATVDAQTGLLDQFLI